MPNGQTEAIHELINAVISGEISQDEFDRITECWNSLRKN